MNFISGEYEAATIDSSILEVDDGGHTKPEEIHYFVIRPPTSGYLEILPQILWPVQQTQQADSHVPNSASSDRFSIGKPGVFAPVVNFSQALINSHRLRYFHNEFTSTSDYLVLGASNGELLIKNIILEITIIERNLVLSVCLLRFSF